MPGRRLQAWSCSPAPTSSSARSRCAPARPSPAPPRPPPARPSPSGSPARPSPRPRRPRPRPSRLLPTLRASWWSVWTAGTRGASPVAPAPVCAARWSGPRTAARPGRRRRRRSRPSPGSSRPTASRRSSWGPTGPARRDCAAPATPVRAGVAAARSPRPGTSIRRTPRRSGRPPSARPTRAPMARWSSTWPSSTPPRRGCCALTARCTTRPAPAAPGSARAGSGGPSRWPCPPTSRRRRMSLGPHARTAPASRWPRLGSSAGPASCATAKGGPDHPGSAGISLSLTSDGAWLAVGRHVLRSA